MDLLVPVMRPDSKQAAFLQIVSAALLLISTAGAQTLPSLMGQTAVTPESQPIQRGDINRVSPPQDKKLFQEIDLLRRNDFEKANQASVSVRVKDSNGNWVTGLGQSNFTLTVNGTVRKAHLVKESKKVLPEKPMVMLVFPPNQPTIHYISVRDAIRYFSGLSAETLAWNVGIFDANGVFTAFTSQKSQLLANLEAVRTANEPAQYSSDRILAKNLVWDGGWLAKANNAITEMQRQPGPKLIMAMNPLGDPGQGATLSQGNDSQPLINGGPTQLTPIAEAIGAHIYIANVGGPEPIVPGGSAAATASTWGTVPSMNQRISPAQTGALNYYAAATSQVMLTAEATLGGFANSISDLAAKMQGDLDSAYRLQFELTPEDQDIGIPEVSVKMNSSALRASVLDVTPVISPDLTAQRRQSQDSAHALLASIVKPIVSPNYEISQRVDYFPVKSGLEAVLPMSCVIAWKGKGERPGEMVIVESIVDQDLNTPLLERKLDTAWTTRGVFWERDGQLRPGHYIWRVAVADPGGHILASAQRNVTVAFPRNSSVAISSLVIGRDCKRHPSANGLRKRPPSGSETSAPFLLSVDPMQLEDCRFAPEPDARFQKDDTLRAFLRIYPDAKLEKNSPEKWNASFTILSPAGTVEAEQRIPFNVDNGSGLVAAAAMHLALPSISNGPHSLHVEVEGPGLKKLLTEADEFSIEP